MLSDINVKGTNHKIGGNIADGQWVSKSVKVFSSVSWSDTGAYQYTVQDYLPDDTYTYEVIVSCYATTTTTSGGNCRWWVKNGDFWQVMGCCITRTNSDTRSGNSGILPLKQENGVLTLDVRVTNAPTGGCGLYLVGYRRLGSQVIPEYYTLTINPTPADATVTFSTGTVSGNSCTVADGTSVTYTVSKTGYASETATVTVTADQTINVTLSTSHYTPGQVLYESSTGGASTTLNLLDDGKYQVICIAGGGGGASLKISSSSPIDPTNYYNDGGGSGSGFDCIFQLTAGNYAIAVGSGGAGKINGTATSGGNSRFGTCCAYGGGGARSDRSVGEGGAGGSAPTLTYTRTTTTLNTTGNTGTHLGGSRSDNVASGGAAVYSSYGKGGDGKYSSVGTGTAGYVKVIYKGV